MAKSLEHVLIQLILLTLLFITTTSTEESKIYGFLPTGKYADVNDPFKRSPVFKPDEEINMYVYGENLTTDLQIGVTDYDDCNYLARADLISVLDRDSKIGLLSFYSSLTDSVMEEYSFQFCLFDPSLNKWILDDTHNNVSFSVYDDPLFSPSFLLIFILFCYCLSALMSGLNIGLMALSPQELELLKKVGTDKEKRYAAKIMPVRKRGNFLLCSILITSTLCNALSTVSIDKFVTSEIAVVITTIIIVLFCEILPQIVCTYFPLSISANTIYITMACMALTAPISYPLSLILNFILGKEITAVYTKERLKELLKMTELPVNEEKLIEGTLELSQKKVEDVMTALDDIFKLPASGFMNFELIELILTSGFSRIPIYVENESDIRYILLTKDLALLDPDDNIPIAVLAEHSKIKCRYIPFGTTLDSALRMFKEGRRHMAFVVDEQSSDGEEKKVLGLITFEDVLEEMFQAEIGDETDTTNDSKSNKHLLEKLRSTIGSSTSNQTMPTETPSENLRLAAFHFICGIDIFSVHQMSRNVLLKLLKLDIYCTTHSRRILLARSTNESIYVKGVPADYFVMILEGIMIVEVGVEGLNFEVGPFKYFGLDALTGAMTSDKSDFKPNFNLIATKRSMYLKISRILYKAALLATNYERLKEVPDINKKSDLYKYFNNLIDQNNL